MLCQATGYPWYNHIKRQLHLLGLHPFIGQSYIQFGRPTLSTYIWQICGALYEQSHGGLDSVARYTPSIYPYGNTRKAIIQGGVH